MSECVTTLTSYVLSSSLLARTRAGPPGLLIPGQRRGNTSIKSPGLYSNRLCDGIKGTIFIFCFFSVQFLSNNSNNSSTNGVM